MNACDLANEVISRCLSIGIDEFVFCPGARDAPFAQALAELEDEVRVWHHFDERSAAFFALGRIMAIARPVAVITTSGTAAAELLPACIEAHYQARPLLLITADRPVEFAGSGAPQSIEQHDLFGKYVDQSIEIENSGPIFEGWTAEGPRHLNVRLDEPLLKVSSEEPTPHEPEQLATRPQPGVVDLARFIGEGTWKGLVVMLGGLEPEERDPVYHFLKDLKVPVLADSTSGLREALGELSLADGDRVLKAKLPGKVLRLGEVPIGRFWRDLENLPKVEVLSVSPNGYSGLARASTTIHSPVAEALESLGMVTEIGDTIDLLINRSSRQSKLSELIERYPDSEPGMIRAISLYATISDLVYLGNSLPVREWNLFAQTEHPYSLVRANRGANGIDGQIASFLGNAADGGDAWAVLGDLTTLYDANAPALESQLGEGRRILVVMNNGGGRIFDRLPGVKTSPDESQQWIRQETEAKLEHLAKLWGCHYHLATSIDDFEFEPNSGLTLLEARPSTEETERFWEAYDLIK